VFRNIHIALKFTKTFKVFTFIIVNCLIGTPTVVNCKAADFDFTPNLQKAYSEIFKLRIQSGKELLAKEKSNNPFKIYLENYIDVVELLNTENEVAYEKVLQKESERLKLIENLDTQKSPYNRFLRAEIKLHWALLKIRFGHEVKAGWNVIQAYRLLEENQRLFPDFLPNQKSLGCLHVLFGSVPENQKWIPKFLGLRGNIQQGVNELKQASKDKIWGLESKFCAFFIQAYVLKFDEKQNAELLQIVDNQSDNLNLFLIATAVSLKENHTEQAIELLRKLPTDAAYIYFPIFELYKAETQLFKGNYTQASIAYLIYLKKFKGKGFVKDTYYKLFVCNWLAGDEKKGRFYLTKIPSNGNAIAESDKAAQKFYENYSKSNILPNKMLLKLRLAFDGGYFEQAAKDVENLSEKNFTYTKDQAEFDYRAGRIYQKLSQYDKGISFFEQAIKLTDGQEWHFGASSSLQLGYIFQAKTQKKKAKTYFEKAISYKGHEYKTSIDNKARAALTEMGY
jgi:tetratricopeptide (TPR) repeat protein